MYQKLHKKHSINLGLPFQRVGSAAEAQLYQSFDKELRGSRRSESLGGLRSHKSESQPVSASVKDLRLSNQPENGAKASIAAAIRLRTACASSGLGGSEHMRQAA
eukprot:scaffold147867_cov20-Tisochrysis_lutea.AAC.3